MVLRVLPGINSPQTLPGINSPQTLPRTKLPSDLARDSRLGEISPWRRLVNTGSGFRLVLHFPLVQLQLQLQLQKASKQHPNDIQTTSKQGSHIIIYYIYIYARAGCVETMIKSTSKHHPNNFQTRLIYIYIYIYTHAGGWVETMIDGRFSR